MRKYLLFFIGLLSVFSAFAQPTISSFAPASGAIGATVTITGTNFNATPANNIVFFGAVRAVVSAASATSLTVTVPLGTTYDPITVTTLNNNLTAYSKRPFHVMFPGAGPVFTPTSFDTHVDFATGVWPYAIANVDLDNEGRPDFAVPNYTSFTISSLRNTSTSGMLSYNPNVDITSGDRPNAVCNGDIDGDGKQDIAITNWDISTVSIFRNISTPGNISFASKVDFATGTNPEGVSIGDIDGDGKPDLVVSDVNSFTISVFRNTTSGGVISFAPRLAVTTGGGGSYVLLRDMDGDNKEDLVIAINGNNRLKIYRNLSTPGTFAFSGALDLFPASDPFGLSIGDLDGDGKLDIVVPNNASGAVSIFRNTSSPASLSFDNKIDYFNGAFTQKTAIADLDGDGKPDLAVTRAEGINQIVSVYKNNSISGLISFNPKVDYTLAAGPTAVTVGDFDGDGLPDIAATATYVHKVTILRNTTVCTTVGINTQPVDNTVCAGSNAVFSIIASNAVSYQWQVDNGSGWTDIINNVIYSGATTNTLSIAGATVSMNNYKYRCVVTNSCGVVNSLSALLIVNTPSAPSLSIIANPVTTCQGSPVTFTAVPVNGGTAPAFQWKKNGINVGINASTYIDNGLVTGDVINCTLTSNGNCITTPVANSNDIVITVNLPVTPTVLISASANNICFGTPVTFTAVPVNGGITPTFQWKKNGINVGTNSINYTDNAINNGDIINCILGTSLTCVTVNTAQSNQVSMVIIPAVIPAVTITASANTICPGTLVTFSAVPVNGGPAPVFQWKKNGVNVGTNSANYTDNTISNGDIISCILTSNLVATCLTTNTANSNTITMAIRNLPGPVSLGADKAGCSGTPIVLNVQPGFVSFLWQDGSTNSNFSATMPGRYYLNATDACGNISSDTVNVSFTPPPSGFLPPDTSICSYSPVLIKPVTSYTQYLWSNNFTGYSITANAPGLYWLQVTDNNNCIGRDSITLFPKDCLKGFYMPNAFTPNGDTKNDLCKPLIFGNVKQYEFTIYNRYGELVFHSRELGKGWDGKIKGKTQNTNVFTWTCTYQLEGQLVNLEKGTVVLIR